MLFRILTVLSAAAFGLIVSPPTIKHIVLFCVFFAFAGFILSSCFFRDAEDLKKNKKETFACGIAALVHSVLSVVIFEHNWTVSSKAAKIAHLFHLPVSTFLYLSGTILAVLSFLFILCIMHFLFFDRKNTDSGILFKWFGLASYKQSLILAVILMQCLELQMSTMHDYSRVFSVKWYMILIAIASIYVVNSLISCFIHNFGIPLLITSSTTLIWSLVNYYAVLLHGSPLFFSEIANAITVANVISEYRFTISIRVLCIVFLFLLELFSSIHIIRSSVFHPKRKTSFYAIRFVLCLIVMALIVVLLRTPSVKPKVTMGFSWKEGVEKYGYLSSIYEDFEKRLQPVVQPEGYSVEKIEVIPINPQEKSTATVKPDVILILNETFYDLNQYTEIPVDKEYLTEFYDIPGAFYGHACAPFIGGGTNNSETELLTSNSMFLLPISAPFTYLDFSENKNCLGDYFRDQGYVTAGMHCGSASNYSRHKVYPEIGFDRILLGKDQFTESFYGERSWTDDANYKDMFELENDMGDAPRFLYLLTMQNHGGWEKNQPEYDVIHTTADYGNLTDDINEYLTSIYFSSVAFRELTEHYAKSERPTIVFMLGDHAPSFISELSPKDDLSSEEQEIQLRSVPYAIWANYDLKWTKEFDYISIPDVGPLLKKAAGLPLSTYDSIILKRHEVVPILLFNGLYQEADGSIHHYDLQGTDDATALIRDYYYMEYNLLRGGKEYRRELFEAND